MSEPFLGEIKMVPFNFAPRGWAKCDGQLLPISEHEALYSLIGTTYGGDGRTTFALPDFRARCPVHQGVGPGLSPRTLGQRTGSERATLTVNNLPSHSHSLECQTARGNESDPAGHAIADANRDRIYSDAGTNAAMDSSSISATGGGQPINVVQPLLTVNFVIALVGVRPTRGDR